MRWLAVSAMNIFLGCNPAAGNGPGDDNGAGDSDLSTGDEAPAWLALEVGEIAEMSVDTDGVWADIANPGVYVVILVSTAEGQGTTFAYGPQFGKSARRRPSDPPPPKRPPPPPERKTDVGDQRTFDVFNGITTVTITAEAIQVTDGVVLWEDLTTPNALGSMDLETIDQVLADLETVVVPREEQIFGAISDVDNDGQLTVLLSYTVNQYGAKAYVTWCDIGVTEGCGASNNGGEVIYLAIPDPGDPSASVNGIVETIAHELNHLIYGYHKFVLNDQAGSPENIYVTEGMSALAQDLTGFNNGNQYVWAAAIDMSDHYGSDDYSVQALSINDILRGDSYYDADRDGALRGGAYLIMRYLFEQAGGMTVLYDGSFLDEGGMAWLQTWFSGPEIGIAALETTTGSNLWDVVLDWYTALVVTGRGLNDDPAFNYQERIEDPITGYLYGFDPFATIHGWLTLTGPLVQLWALADGDIRAGGVEYLKIITPPGRISLTIDPDAVPRARLFRIE